MQYADVMTKGRARAAILAAASLFSIASITAQGAEVSRPVLDFAIQTGPDKYVWLADHAGKTLIVAFILTDCSHCQFTTGLLKDIQKDYAGQGVEVLESAVETMSALYVADFIRKTGVTFPVGYNDLNYAARFLGYPDNQPLLMPQIIFIDKGGTIRQQFAGDDASLAKDIQDKTLRATLDMTLKQGKPGATKAAQPKGR